MENPIQQQEILDNNPESKEKALELIESIIEEYNTETKIIINNYLNTSKIKFDDDILHSDEQRKVLIPLVGKIKSIFDQLLTTLQGYEYSDNEPSYIKSLRSLYGIVYEVKELLQVAPDAKYSIENLTQAYGGKENIPAGKLPYEKTQDVVLKFQSTIEGIKIGLGLIK